MTLPKQPPREIVADYIALCRKVERADELVLDLLAHPDTTPEQLASARATFRHIRKMAEDIRTSLQVIYPHDHASLRGPLPWHSPI